MTWFKESYIDSGIAPIKLADATSNTNDFGTGLVGQYVDNPARLQNAVENLGVDVGLTVRLPAGPVSDLMPIGFGSLMLPINAKNTEGGWHFADFIGNDPENNSLWCAAFGQIPPRFSFRDSVVYTSYRRAVPGIQAFVDGQSNAFPQYYGPGVNQVFTAYGLAQESVFYGEDPATALGAAQENAQEALDFALEAEEAAPRTFPEFTGGYES